MEVFEMLKKIECAGYLLVHVRVPQVTYMPLPMKVRMRIKRHLTKEGFSPFLKNWVIKPIFNAKEREELEEKLTKLTYTIAVQMSLMYIRKDDFITTRTIELESEVANLLKDE